MEFTKETVIITTLVLAFVVGIVWLIKLFFQKVAVDFKYNFKYKFLKKKYKLNEIELIQIFLDQDQSEDDMYKTLLIEGVGIKQAKKLRYIFKQLKGGGKDGRFEQVKGEVKEKPKSKKG